VQQILRTVHRIGQRRAGALSSAGIAVNRLGRTRDAKYWLSELEAQYGTDVLPPVHLRAAVAEAAAQSLPIHLLGRSGAAEAAAEFDALLARVTGTTSADRAAGSTTDHADTRPPDEQTSVTDELRPPTFASPPAGR
jgi:hypothetical protein